uniref:Tudor domain-containing protein n=1 Tax=Panagrellus redivivus TaxID=6233 RepID=A0A7E4WCV6_PANRE
MKYYKLNRPYLDTVEDEDAEDAITANSTAPVEHERLFGDWDWPYPLPEMTSAALPEIIGNVLRFGVRKLYKKWWVNRKTTEAVVPMGTWITLVRTNGTHYSYELTEEPELERPWLAPEAGSEGNNN